MSAIAEVYEVTYRLPARVDDIYGMLQILGIKGQQDDPLACPMANLLRLFSNGERVAVDTNCYIEVGDAWFESPAVVDAFVGMFDEGCFPELVERRAIEARPTTIGGANAGVLGRSEGDHP